MNASALRRPWGAAAYYVVCCVCDVALAAEKGGILRVIETRGLTDHVDSTRGRHGDSTNRAWPIDGGVQQTRRLRPAVPQNSLSRSSPEPGDRLDVGSAEQQKTLTFNKLAGAGRDPVTTAKGVQRRPMFKMNLGPADPQGPRRGLRLKLPRRAGTTTSPRSRPRGRPTPRFFQLKRPQGPGVPGAARLGLQPRYIRATWSPAEMRPAGRSDRGRFKSSSNKTKTSRSGRAQTPQTTGTPTTGPISTASSTTVIPTNRSTAILTFFSFVAGQGSTCVSSYRGHSFPAASKTFKSPMAGTRQLVRWHRERRAHTCSSNPVSRKKAQKMAQRHRAAGRARPTSVHRIWGARARGRGHGGGPCCPRTEGLWGLPPEFLKTLPGSAPGTWKKEREGSASAHARASARARHASSVKVSTAQPGRSIAILAATPDRPKLKGSGFSHGELDSVAETFGAGVPKLVAPRLPGRGSAGGQRSSGRATTSKILTEELRRGRSAHLHGNTGNKGDRQAGRREQ